ncbi:MAG: M20/M25/M40 family metallo-hydrolase, partial [Traorella sp.]
MKIRNEILKQLDELKKIRKKLHIIPEIGFDTFETMKVVEECIGRKADLVGHNCGVFYLPYGEKCIAFRCELDALEIHEDIHHDCISKNQNMHACGHDLHMAIMIMTYKYFIAHPPSCSLLFIFQNAEES